MSQSGFAADASTDFHRHQDISYVDPGLPPGTLRQAVRHYLASALLYGLALLFITLNPWFRDLLQVPLGRFTAARLYLYAYAAYVVIAPLVFFLAKPRSLWVSKNLLILGYLARLARWVLRRPAGGGDQGWRPTYAEKHALMFFGIKLLYGPLMVNSALIEYNAWPQLLQQLRFNPALLNVCDKGYLLFVSGVFFLDSLLFAVGYHTESGLLRNRLRYAETNPWHILVCVACYGPFNLTTAAVLGPSNHNPYILFHGDPAHPVTWILRGAAVLFLLLLTAASLSLFTKASNLTNRGIVDWGPYRYIRHPGYLAKNLFWLVTLVPAFFPNPAMPGFSWGGYLAFCAVTVGGFAGWVTLYFLRAITEERFLMRDPDYVTYCQKVKYRFIPGVY